MPKKYDWKYVGSTHHFKGTPKEDDYSWVWGIIVILGILFLIAAAGG